MQTHDTTAASAAEQVRDFAVALFDPFDLIEVRLIAPRVEGTPPRPAPRSEWFAASELAGDRALAWMSSANAEGIDVYIGANPRKSRGRSAKDVARARCVFADIDDSISIDELRARIQGAALPAPTAIVSSGHGWHVYWRLTEAIEDMSAWRATQQSLIHSLRSDTAIKDPPRVMRLPGFRNHKPPAADCELVDVHPERRTDLETLHRSTLSESSRREILTRASQQTRDFIHHGAQQGKRNSRLFKAAADLAGLGAARAEAEALLIPAAERCGLERDEALQAIGSALSKARTPSRPDDVISPAPAWQPPVALIVDRTPPPFPLRESFPPGTEAIRDFVESLSESLQVPIDLPTMLLLPIVSVSIAQKAEIEVREGWREIAALWTLSLMESGERKSATFGRMIAPLQQWEKDEGVRLDPLIRKQREAKEVRERKLAKLRGAIAEGTSIVAQRELDELLREERDDKHLSKPLILASDTTTEALSSLLIANQERAIVASPEADAIDVLLGRYSDKGSANMGIWLKGHAGDSERTLRRGREPEYLNHPALSVALAVQPKSVHALFTSDQARGRGLLARLLVCAPLSRIGQRKTGGAALPVPAELSAQYDAIIARLLRLPIDSERGPVIVRLSPEAHSRFARLEADIERMLAVDGELSDRRDWGGKLAGHIARIALALHALERWGVRESGINPQEQINLATMEAALAWAPYLMAQERIVACIVGSDPSEGIAARVLALIARENLLSFTKRDAFCRLRTSRLQQTQELDPALRLLEDHSYIRASDPSPRVGPGRPASTVYLVNPLWNRQQP